jgi:hypothetical protein
VDCPLAASINIVATLNGIIFLSSFSPSPLLFYQKEGSQGFKVLHWLLSNKNIRIPIKNSFGDPPPPPLPTPRNRTFLGGKGGYFGYDFFGVGGDV